MQSLKAAIQNTPLDFSKTYPLSVLNIGQDVGLTPTFTVGDLIKDILGEEPVPAPPEGLVSNFNYFFDDGGNVLTGVQLVVNFTEDFISTSNGSSFQLNCYSQEPYTTEWQQYCIIAPPNSTQLFAVIANWAGANDHNPLIFPNALLFNMPYITIQQNYQLIIELNYDSTGKLPASYVTGATYAVVDTETDPPNTLGIVAIDILDQMPHMTSAILAPIVAFTFNIGGAGNGMTATLRSGAGNITYNASNPLTIVNAEPKYTAFGTTTLESANLNFGALTQTGSQTITQSFTYT